MGESRCVKSSKMQAKLPLSSQLRPSGSRTQQPQDPTRRRTAPQKLTRRQEATEYWAANRRPSWPSTIEALRSFLFRLNSMHYQRLLYPWLTTGKPGPHFSNAMRWNTLHHTSAAHSHLQSSLSNRPRKTELLDAAMIGSFSSPVGQGERQLAKWGLVVSPYQFSYAALPSPRLSALSPD
jgi:hypothetical protein